MGSHEPTAWRAQPSPLPRTASAIPHPDSRPPPSQPTPREMAGIRQCPGTRLRYTIDPSPVLLIHSRTTSSRVRWLVAAAAPAAAAPCVFRYVTVF